MIFYHLQHYFAIDREWHDIPHVNGGCSISLDDILDVYDDLINLSFTSVSEYRIIVSGRSNPLPDPKPKSISNSNIIQLSLFDYESY